MTGPELRAALAELGLTQAEFAALIGDHPVTISKRVREMPDAPIPKHVDLIIDHLRLIRALEQQLAKLQQAA